MSRKLQRESTDEAATKPEPTADRTASLTTLEPREAISNLEATDDPGLAGIPVAVIANIGCYDTDCPGGCG